ncbi:MAG: hypothetical protein ACE5JM_10890, partial [Armatimonadota bacterium]
MSALLGHGKLAEARLKVRELMLAHPDDPAVQQELYWLLGIIRLRMGRLEQAVTAADKLEELLRRHPVGEAQLRDRPIVLRLQALLALERFAEARQVAKPLLARPEDDPGFLGGIRYAAHSYMAEERLDDAVSFL